MGDSLKSQGLNMLFKLFITGTVFFNALFSFIYAENLFVEKEKIEKKLELKGQWLDKEKVFKISMPRKDIKVKVDGTLLSPFLGLTSWISFTNENDSTIAMGDLVLFEDEVNPVMRKALEKGLSVTALHNHFFFDHPKVFFMHILAKGNSENISLSLKEMFDEIKNVRSIHPNPKNSFDSLKITLKNSISKEKVQNILGIECQEQSGMVKAILGKDSNLYKTSGKEMGINSWAGFGGANEKAFVDGDIAVSESQLQKVLKILQHSNINVVAIHNHMIFENPRILFVHFWSKGKVEDLAMGIKLVFDEINH